MKIFITTDLNPGHKTAGALTATGHTVRGESLLDFQYVPFNYFPPCEWIFFYSPRCVEFFFASADERFFRNSKLAVMGPGTARALLATDRVPDFIGNGNPQQTAESFGGEAYEQRVLFPQASNSRKSIEKLLANDISAVDIVVYDNVPKSDFTVPDSDILIFTSPLNVKAYFSKYRRKAKHRIIAIGKTTAESLRAEGVSGLITAEKPTTEGIVQAVGRIVQTGA